MNTPTWYIMFKITKNSFIAISSLRSGYLLASFKAIRSAKQVIIEYSNMYTLNRLTMSVKALGKIYFNDSKVIGVFFSCSSC
jgi:hypothetical protein